MLYSAIALYSIHTKHLPNMPENFEILSFQSITPPDFFFLINLITIVQLTMPAQQGVVKLINGRIWWRYNILYLNITATTKKKEKEKLISSDTKSLLINKKSPLFTNSGDFSLLFSGREKSEAIAK